VNPFRDLIEALFVVEANESARQVLGLTCRECGQTFTPESDPELRMEHHAGCEVAELMDAAAAVRTRLQVLVARYAGRVEGRA
jgi:hypothetical protein